MFQSSALAEQRSRLMAAKEKYADLQIVYGPAHPKIKGETRRITYLENSLRSAMAKAVQVVKQDLNREQEVVASLERELASLRTNTGILKQRMVPLRELERGVEAAKSVYVQTLTRIREIRSQQGVDASNVRVLSQSDIASAE